MKHLDCLADFFDPHRPWLILPDMFNSLAARAERLSDEKVIHTAAKGRDSQFLQSKQAAAKSFPRKGENFRGPVDLPGMMIGANGVAEIPIYGIIGDKIDPFVKWYFDATDLRDVQSEIQQAESDPTVKAVVFTHDSPGGSSRNIPETATMIQGMSKLSMSYVDGMCCSADFWLACATSYIASSPSGDVGSIGAYSAYMDMSGLYAAAGVKVRVYASGTYKGAGYPGTELSPEQAMQVKADVDEVAGEFKAFVQKSRGQLDPSTMQGQSFSASKALQLKLIDGLMLDKSSMIRML